MSEQEGLHSVEAEQSVLGVLLLDPQSYDRIAGVVFEPDFSSRDHRAIFRAISRLIETGKPVDVITAAEFLESHKLLEQVGGLSYLGQLAQNTPAAANVKRYAEIVRERSLLRKLADATREVSELIHNRGGKSPLEILDLAQAKMMQLSDIAGRSGTGPQRIPDVMGRVVETIDELYRSEDKSEITGMSTGYTELDKMTAGFQPGDLVIVAARPSMGKTALALNIAEHVGVKNNKPVLIFSFEMTNEQLCMRLMSSLSGIHAQRVRTGRIYDGEWERINSALGRVGDTPIYLDDDASITPVELHSRARRVHRDSGGLALIVIDYLQLMESGGSEENRAREIGKISGGLKKLAKELHCPVIALSQLNRSLESRPNKRPIMSDLRDSGSIEQDADTVIFIYRDEVYNEDSPDKGLAELIMAKQRNGPIGRVVVSFDGAQTRFIDRPHSAPLPSASLRDQRLSKRAETPRAKNESYRDVDM